eukprot:SRR837773.10682.p1 GENE.SRR837773.10682~~SRR837773.10682.p1  ORF type:complete len:341 (-),score=108.01 SRR837773.10682:149-1054(-)
MSWREVPRSLFLRVREHLIFRWAACDGSNDAFEQEIKGQLSPVLKRELCYHIYGRTLKAAPFLSWMHEAALKDLANVVESVFMSKGDFVFRIGEVNEQVHIMLQGTCRLSLNESLFQDSTKETEEENARGMQFFRVAMQAQTAKKLNKARQAFSRTKFLKSASAVLRKKEAQETWAARFIQRLWREGRNRHATRTANKRRLPGEGVDRTQSHGMALQSTAVSAPCFLGEVCLWQPFEEWSQKAPKYRYSARCESRMELVLIRRQLVQEIVTKYQPWQGDRLRYFQQCVRKEMRRAACPCAP